MKLFYSLIEPKQQIPDERKLFTNSMLKAMIVPLLIEQLLQMIVGLADTMMVSHAGEAVVAGVGLDTMIYTIFIYLFTAISAGGSVVVAQYIGSKDRENGNLAASQIFYLSGVLSLFCMVVMPCSVPICFILCTPVRNQKRWLPVKPICGSFPFLSQPTQSTTLARRFTGRWAGRL